jgi:UDP-N-acetylglucosamine--N-acetylmuramyl-(pentapeptide) pyrophosphoryl-undecaprenol N-acetylglucosamine transferase
VRVIFCGGGTGGHVYPALTVASALRRLVPASDLDLLYIGVRGKLDAELVAREGIDFEGITAGPLRVGNPAGTGAGAVKLGAGIIESLRIMRRFRPDVVFATGGYGSAGAGLASRLRRTPLLLFLPDVAAGFAVKLLARVAGTIAVTVEPALHIMPASRTVLTGYPVRATFFEANREESRRRLNLDLALPLLLVSGGSTGARAINEAIAASLPRLLERAQVLHVSGAGDEARLRERAGGLPEWLRERYHLHAYLHEDIAAAYAAADLAVMRAGASVLGELPAACLPAVLVPGEFSDQADNARYLEGAGAALMLPQSRLAELEPLLLDLLQDEGRLEAMRHSLAALRRPDAAERIARLVVEMASGRATMQA